MHNASQVLLGSTRQGGSGFAKVVSSHSDSPATFKAGLAVRMSSTGALSLSSGFLMGVSLGKSLSDTTRTAVCRKSGGVPLRILKYYGTVTISSYANLVDSGDDEIVVAGVTFVAQTGAATPGDATFRAATSNNATASSLATQINAHATAGAKVYAQAASAVVHLVCIEDNPTEAPTLTYSDEGTSTVGASVSGSGTLSTTAVTRGTPVYMHSTLGKAVASTHTSAVATNAVYAQDSAYLEGLDPDGGSSVAVAMIDMEGGI